MKDSSVIIKKSVFVRRLTNLQRESNFMTRLVHLWVLLLFATPVVFSETPPPPPAQNKSGGGRSSKETLPFLYIGGLIGMVYPPESIGARSRVGVGATLQFRLSRSLGFGAYYLHNAREESSGFQAPYDKSMIKIDAYGGELNYWIKYGRLASRIGYRMGPSRIFVNNMGVNSGSTSPIHYGPVGSMDVFISPQISLGAEANLLFFGDIIEYAPFITYYLNGALKIWF